MDYTFLGLHSEYRTHPIKILLFATVLAGIAASLLIGLRFSLIASFYLASLMIMMVALELFAWNTFFCKPSTPKEARDSLQKKPWIPLVLCVLVAAVLAVLAVFFGLRGSTWKVFVLRSAVYFLVFFFLITLAFYLKTNLTITRESFLSIGKFLGISVILLAISALCAMGLGSILEYSFIGILLFCFAVISALCASIYYLVKNKQGTHVVYPVIVVCFGLLLIGTLPTKMVVSWDDQIHFSRAVAVSQVAGITYTPQDEVAFMYDAEAYGIKFIPTSNAMQFDELQSYEDALNSLEYSEDDVVLFGNYAYYDGIVFDSIMISYIPAAMGVWLGGVLCLPYTWMMRLAKLFGLLFYAVLVYLSLRITPKKKNLLGLIAIIPAGIFLASSYAYDFWVTGFLFVATAIILKERYQEGPSITNAKLAVLLFVFFLALLPKAIYVPFLGLVLLIPKRRFSSVRQRRLFIVAAILLVLYVCASFVAPFFSAMSVGTVGDSRGGDNVDSQGQLFWIFGHLAEFLGMFGNFLFATYLNPLNMSGATYSLAYFGGYRGIEGQLLTLLILLAAILEDNTPFSSGESFSSNAWALFLYILTAALVALALYVSYTPVGASSVNGCQFRYLIPMFFPAFAFGLDLHTKLRINSRWFTFCMQVVGMICVAADFYMMVVASILV